MSGDIDKTNLSSSDNRRISNASSTSIHVFQQNDSLAAFITLNAGLSDSEFLRKHPHPVLLTSMPDEIALAVWTVMLPIRKKSPRGLNEETLVKKNKDLYLEIASRPTRFFIGRAPECDIVLAPRSISRHHASFAAKDGTWQLTDHKSTNGTRVAGTLLAPQIPAPLGDAPTQVDFGLDTNLWFATAAALLNYIKSLRRQVEDTSRHDIRNTTWEPMSIPGESTTPSEPIPLRNSAPTQLSIKPPVDIKLTVDKARAEAETNPLVRDLKSPMSTWHDDDETDERPVEATLPVAASPPSMQMSLMQSQRIDPEPKLMAAIRAIAAMDSLILNVTARLRNNPQNVVIFTAEESMKPSDVADQLIRLGPMLKTVWITLSVGDGSAVEVFSTDSSIGGTS
jgi:hypothetical protein